jgi:hypothetical protein
VAVEQKRHLEGFTSDGSEMEAPVLLNQIFTNRDIRIVDDVSLFLCSSFLQLIPV